MGLKALHSWGWEAWWGWDTKCSPFRVIVPDPHSMGPISPGARDPSYSWHMNGTSIGWYTVCSGRVWKSHLISTSPGIRVPQLLSLESLYFGKAAHSAAGFAQLGIFRWRRGMEGWNETQALDVWTGICHSSFLPGRRISLSFRCPSNWNGSVEILPLGVCFPKQVENRCSGALQFTNMQGCNWHL